MVIYPVTYFSSPSAPTCPRCSVDVWTPCKALKQPPAEVLDENFRIVQANYTGSPYGELEWAAIKRRMEKRMGPGYKDM